MNKLLYVLKVSLVGIKPEIWRRFVVPADITLDRLHDVIQIVMGWQDYHLHQFAIGDKRYTEDPESPEDGKDDGRYRLGNLLKRKGMSFEYVYDFGDDWVHQVTLEEINHALGPREEAVRLLAGEGACPPEDVGGVGGYAEYCEAMKDKKHPRHDEYVEWRGETFNSETVDIDERNIELLKYLRWSRPRLAMWDV
ncbi:MAG: plasmid pRiA4b ORF-3 family protein [Nitrospiraceae bacterium]|nr:plasmid pRiA4b ORF-3 family protein [Nitrospiraceae bacterium]